MIPLFWFRSSNFGDILNPIIYKHITGREPEWSDKSPKIHALGSTAHMAQPHDFIWGSGILKPEIPIKGNENTKVLATRGPLTDELLTKAGMTVSGIHGDPGLLLPKWIPPAKNKKYKLGLLPHYADAELIKDFPKHIKFLNVNTEPLELIEEITSCEGIISSALHGIIVAEAYGIPAKHVIISDKVHKFKFDDYYKSTKRAHLYHFWHKIDWDKWKIIPFNLYWNPPIIDLEKLLSVCPFNMETK